jgi:hypothetical protein
MTNAEVKKKLPIKEGLFKLPTDKEEGYLIGSRCKKCGDYFHPKKYVCANCHSYEMEEVALSTRGKIYTYTISRTSYPGSPLVAPFIIAFVELPVKVQVISLITDVDLNEVKIGMEVELYFLKLSKDAEGNELMGYAFKPVSG